MSTHPQQQQNAPTVIEKNIADSVLERINAFQESGQLKLPSDYHAGNALKSAFLILRETVDRNQKPVLESCTRESIAFALQKMVVLGLNPLKKQCDFIAYGNVLTCSPEYTANEMLAKRYGMKAIFKKEVYKDDEFEDGVDEKGRTVILKHKPCSLDKRKKENIVGVYATVEMDNGEVWSEVMTMEQVRDAWNQGAAKGNSPAHKNFPGEMAKKTVSNRATKSIIRSSDDAALFNDDEGVRETPESAVASLNAAKASAAEEAEVISFESAKPAEPVQIVAQNPTVSSNELTDEEKAEIAREEAELAAQANTLFGK